MGNDALRSYWHPVAVAADVGERPVAARLLGEQLVLYRAGAAVVCFADLCIHRGAALSCGWVAGENLVCGYHGWTYAPDGRCVEIPSLPPEQSIPRKARAIAYPAVVRYGLVWACLAGEARAPIPAYPELDDPAFRTFLIRVPPWRANAGRVAENFMDETHFPWVHPGTLGDRQRPRWVGYTVQRTGDGLRWDFELIRPDGVRQHSAYSVALPFTVRIVQTQATGSSHVVMNFCHPVSDTETIQYGFLSRTYDRDAPDDTYEAFERAIYDQDQTIVESQRPELLPLDLSEELHLKGADSAGIEYRRLLRALLEGEVASPAAKESGGAGLSPGARPSSPASHR